MKIIKIDFNNSNQRLDKYLLKLLPLANKSLIYKMIRKKDIKVNKEKVDINYIVKENDIISLFLHEDRFESLTNVNKVIKVPIQFKVIYEDNNILIVDKPIGLLVQKENENTISLTEQVSYYLKQNGDDISKPAPVHRLDRNTSGLVIFGKNFITLKVLNQMIKDRECLNKYYLTLVSGEVKKANTLTSYMIKADNKVKLVSKDTKNSLTMITKYKPIITNKDFSLLEVLLITGRTHQIRVHLASINHEILGDRKYGDFELNKKYQNLINHQFLHAYKIEVVNAYEHLSYLNNKVFISNLPNKLETIKKQLLEK